MRRFCSALTIGLLSAGLLLAENSQASDTYLDNVRFSGDFNGDGNQDLFWRNTSTGANYIHLSSGGVIASSLYVNSVTDQAWQVQAIADINGDGKDDVIWRHATTNMLFAFLMSSNQVSSSGQIARINSEWQIAGSGDLNGDGKDDLVWRNSLTGDNYVFLMNGIKYTGAAINRVQNQTWKIAAVKDFDGNGKADIYWRNVSTGENVVYLMNGSAISTLTSSSKISGEWLPNAFCDLNADGKTDIVWRNLSTGANYIHLMNGAKIASNTYLNTVKIADWQLSGCGDINLDKKADLIWQHKTTGAMVAFQMNAAQISKTSTLRTVNKPWVLANGMTSAASNIVLPTAPSLLQGTATSDSQISLTWKDNSSNETGFVLQRNVVGSNAVVSFNIAANATSYQDALLSPETSYQYTLYAINANGASSKISATVTTKAKTTNTTTGIDLSNVQSMQIQPAVLRTNTDKTQQAVAIGINKDGSVVPMSHVVTWSVADTSVATVTSDGLLTIKNQLGSTTLTASYGNLKATYALGKINTGYPDKFSIFLKKPSNYPDAYIYIWTIASQGATPSQPVGAWPGVKMTDVSATYGAGWYQFEIGTDAKYISFDKVVHFKFNGGLNQAESPNDFTRLVSDGSQWWNNADSNSQDTPPGDVIGGGKVLIKTVTPGTIVSTLDKPDVDVSGEYFAVGTVLNVIAPEAPIGSAFNHWAGDGAHYLLNATAAKTKLVVVEADVLTLIPQFSTVASDGHELGRAEYSKQCENCHGDNGDGGPFQIPLTYSALKGKYASVSVLAQYISDKMPNVSPGTCVGDSVGECAYDIANMIFADAWVGPSIRSCDATSLDDLKPSDRNLRLLTRQEYLNSVNDLTGLQFDASLLDSISADQLALNFDTSSEIIPDNSKIAGYDAAAKLVAEKIVSSKGFYGLASCGSDTNCVVEKFGRKLFRRPLSSAEITRYAALYSNSDQGKTVLQGLFSSPYFLFRSELGQLDSTTGFYKLTNYEIATLLSYTFWATTPDDTLLDAAASSSFDVKAQTERLLTSEKAKTAFRRFVAGWLLDPRFNFPVIDSTDLQNAMKEETMQFVTNTVFGNLNYEELLTADYTYVNALLAKHYGMNSAISGWQKQTYTGDNTQRSGILGHASFLATHTSSARTSPIKRGVYIRHALMCQEFPPPVAANIDGQVDLSVSIKDLFKAHTDDEGCQSCHQFIDDIGWGFQNYGMDGLLRSTELAMDGKTVHSVDGNGGINSLYAPETVLESGVAEPFTSLKELGDLIAQSPNSSACYARQFYRYSVGRKEKSDDECSINVFGQKFVHGQQTLKQLMVEYTQLPNFMLRK